MQVDVVIIGGSLSGCTAAMLYGRAGLSVAVIERQRSMDAYKALCGHFILGGAQGTLRRLGLWDRMIEAGAALARPAVWVGSGWMEPPAEVPQAISLRRSGLDPLVRRMALETPGVELLLGHTVVGVLEEGRRVTGVDVRDPAGRNLRIEASLVVAADGHRSPTAALAGVTPRAAGNGRFLVWGYYRGAQLRSPGEAALWLVDPHAAVAVPTDDGLTMIGAFPSTSLRSAFEGDRLGALERFVAQLPDAPDLSGAERVSKAIGTTEHTMLRRPPVPRPGLALIGDAATAADPVPAVGCTWALRSAEWLADATEHALRTGTDPAPGLRAYARRHRFVDRHDRLIRQDAAAGPPNPIQRSFRTAALHDHDIALRLGRHLMRDAPVSGLLNPATVTRAVRVARRQKTVERARTTSDGAR